MDIERLERDPGLLELLIWRVRQAEVRARRDPQRFKIGQRVQIEVEGCTLPVTVIGHNLRSIRVAHENGERLTVPPDMALPVLSYVPDEGGRP